MPSAELREELNNLRNRIADNGEQAEAMRILAPELWARVMGVLAVWAVERFEQDQDQGATSAAAQLHDHDQVDQDRQRNAGEAG